MTVQVLKRFSEGKMPTSLGVDSFPIDKVTMMKREKCLPSVLLVSLPWTSLGEPSLGLGLLKAVLERHGIPCRVQHLNLFLLAHLKASTYAILGRSTPLNDFLFSGALDPTLTNAQQRYLRKQVGQLVNQGSLNMMEFKGSEGLISTLLRLRNEVLPNWLAGWADEIAHHEATLVGFTCMFDQTIASLALARMVRERASNKMLVLGGYSVRSPTAQMIIRSNPWIDAVCDGEGEITIVELARAAAGEITLDEVRGIVYRSATGEPLTTPPPPLIDLDTNPTPNFNDYFYDIKRLSNEHNVDVMPVKLPIENSRGCWWGYKSHCIFCGINDKDLFCRTCDAMNVLANMAELKLRYNIDWFHFKDYILPHQYFDTLLPELVRLGQPYRISTEIKANITEERFALMAQAGIVDVQPGIESFSTSVLRKIRKGVSAVQNVHTLLLGRRYGVRVYYNLLYGFPNDNDDEYERMVAILPRLLHLDPPVSCLPVQITRYSPLQVRPEDFGINLAEPDPAYELIFSRDYRERTGFSLEDYCYVFERPFENSVRLTRYYTNISEIVTAWTSMFIDKTTWLYSDYSTNNGLKVYDRRGPDETIHYLDVATTELLRACSRPISINALHDANIRFVPKNCIGDIVDELDTLGLVFKDGEWMISLVLDGPPPLVVEKAQDELPTA
jgi:ribosomal peptide maturation radical SAM protein 1